MKKYALFCLSFISITVIAAFTAPSVSVQSSASVSSFSTDSVNVEWFLTDGGAVDIYINGNLEILDARDTSATTIYLDNSFTGYHIDYKPDPGHVLESQNAGYNAPSEKINCNS